MEPKLFVGWEEVFVSNERGNRIVHYFLDRSDGGSDLAVVGKEKSLRHMSYTVPNQFLRSLRPALGFKWRSRREVVDWLSSLVSGSLSCGSSPQVDRLLDDEDPCSVDGATSKDLPSGKISHLSKEFSWLGSPWTCRKRRRHYQSFCRNGITIYVHDFVYIMGEGYKRLVAYLEDMYEDSRGNNMVVVRWFHKVDEVGLVLPPNFNNREVFFSLSLQDIRIECIDGLAAVLSPQHFEKFLNEVASTVTLWDPYMCHRQFDNLDVKPFDIAQVEGYWNQELLKYMYSASRASPASSFNPISAASNVAPSKSRKKHRSSLLDPARTGVGEPVSTGGGFATCLLKDVAEQKHKQRLCVESQVEVLSQDSGIRGCWFRAIIIKKHKGKVKVRYLDLQDAEETGNVEEWVVESKVAAADMLGMRIGGRTTVRPLPPTEDKISYGGFDVGAPVDVWWHDGWWEGILILKESEDKFHVYFPGEVRTSIFSSYDMRISRDWVSHRWTPIKERLDLVSLILSNQVENMSSNDMQMPASDGQAGCSGCVEGGSTPAAKSILCGSPRMELGDEKRDSKISNLPETDLFVHLKWSASKKRRRNRERLSRRNHLFFKRRHWEGNGISGSGSGSGSSGSSSSQDDDLEFQGCDRSVIPKPLKVNREVCKYISDPPIVASMPPVLSSLVMSM